jgi:hypothetical protein
MYPASTDSETVRAIVLSSTGPWFLPELLHNPILTLFYFSYYSSIVCWLVMIVLLGCKTLAFGYRRKGHVIIGFIRSNAWNPLHWTTWLLFLIEGGVLAYFHFVGSRDLSATMRTTYTRGIPETYIERYAPDGAFTYIDWNPLFYDALVWLILVLGPILLYETWSRRRLQFPLKLLLILPFVLAIVLANLNARLMRELLPEPVQALHALTVWFAASCWLVIITWLAYKLPFFAYRTIAGSSRANNG